VYKYTCVFYQMSTKYLILNTLIIHGNAQNTTH